LELAEPCLVKLEVFEGPLDLLLHLIKKNEIDIYNIPLAIITEQYLEYLEMMKRFNLEVVGDYLLVAAELGFIKSNMLLPLPELQTDEEEHDPRAELVRRLIEYQRYKEAAMKLSVCQILERDVFIRMCQDDEEETTQPMKADLWSLVDALRDVYKRRHTWPDLIQLDLDALTLDEKIEELISKIRLNKMLFFEDLFGDSLSSFDFILTFLAVLELVRTSAIAVFQDSPYAPIRLVYLGEPQFGT